LADVWTRDGMYVAGGRDSVPPERLLKASLLMAFYTVRSEGCSASNVRQPAFPFDHRTFLPKIGRGCCSMTSAKLFFGRW